MLTSTDELTVVLRVAIGRMSRFTLSPTVQVSKVVTRFRLVVVSLLESRIPAQRVSPPQPPLQVPFSQSQRLLLLFPDENAPSALFDLRVLVCRC